MNKKFPLLLIFTVFTSFVFAQKRSFDTSVFIGFNGIHIEGDNEVLYNSNNGTVWGTGGVSAGLAVKREFINSFYWTFDLRYIRKGSIYEFINIQGVQDFESIKFDYAELPLSMGYKTNIGKRYIYIEMGTAIAKLINSEKLVSEHSNGQDISLFNKFKDYDFSMLGAIKLSTNRKEKILYGIRVARSFISIHETYKLYNFDYGIEMSYFF